MVSRPHLTHVALFVRDVERSVAFYRRFCDLDVVHDRTEPSGGRVVWVGEQKHRPRFVLVLIHGTPDDARSAPSSFAHFGFSCRTRHEVDARAALARDAGVLELPPRDAGGVVGYYCILRDPDGNAVEFSHGQTIDPGFFGRPMPARRSRKPPARRRVPRG
jgi:catechol 2,3-dioxygenase-like lactoylglutathione lyase family enzyme